MKNSKLFLTLATIGLGMAFPTMGATPINSCADAEIWARGNYILNVDLPCGISIRANNVLVQLNGHKLNGPGSDRGTGISVGSNSDHITIEGPGLVRNFSSGFSAFECQYCQVRYVTFSQNGNGMDLNNGTFLTVESNLLVDNGSNSDFRFDGYGIRMGFIFNSSFAFNDISGNSRSGIYLVAGSGNTINNNVISGNSGSGLQFGYVSAYNVGTSRVYSNTLNGNGESGIQVFVSGSFFNDRDNKFFNNSAKGNKVFDLEDIVSCARNVWADNQFFVASLTCIR